MPAGGLVTVAAIGGISSLIGSKNSSNAAKKAAETQAKSAQSAIDLQKQTTDKILPTMQSMYTQGQAGYAPYTSMGNSATSRLSSMLGFAPASASSGQASTATPAQQSMAQMGTPQQAQGGMVTVQSPDGETRQVPQAQAQFYASRGAKILGGGGNATPSNMGGRGYAM